MKKFEDMNAIERKRYMSNKYLDLASRNISRQFEEIERAKRKLDGEPDEDVDYTEIMHNLEKLSRSNRFYLIQVRQHMTYNNAADTYGVLAGASNVFTSDTTKLNYQYNIILDVLDNILDDIRDDPSKFDYSIFDDLIKLYNNLVKAFQNNFGAMFNPDGTNKINNVKAESILKRTKSYMDAYTNKMNEIKRLSQEFGTDKGKIGSGKIPPKHL